MTMQLDEIDQKLIALLAENARVSVAVLARKLGIARTTVQSRIERLEHRGAIAGYTLRMGADLRPAFRASVLINIGPRAGAAVLARLKDMPEVQRAHTVSGRVDLLVELGAASSEALDRCLDEISEVTGVNGSESLIHLTTKLDRLR